jgi:hypothetical protein
MGKVGSALPADLGTSFPIGTRSGPRGSRGGPVKIIPFPNRPLVVDPDGANYTLNRDSSLVDIFFCLETDEANCILFVDQSDYCRQYLAGSQWIERYATAVEVDQAIIDHFKIELVPLWIWFQNGSETLRGVGTETEKHIIDAVAQARWTV